MQHHPQSIRLLKDTDTTIFLKSLEILDIQQMLYFSIHFAEKHRVQEILDRNANLLEGKEILLNTYTQILKHWKNMPVSATKK